MSVDQQNIAIKEANEQNTAQNKIVNKELTWAYSIVGKPILSNTLKNFLTQYSFETDNLDPYTDDADEEDGNTCATPLTKAISLGLTDIVKELLEHEVDVNLWGKTDITDLDDGENFERTMTPLEIACYFGYTKIIQMLLLCPDIKLNSYGSEASPIALASYYGHKKAVDMLVAAGENPANGLPPSSSYLQSLIHSIFTSLHHEYLRAEQQNKKLLIIIGEEHKSWRSFLLNSIIIRCIKKLGIKNIMLECDDERITNFHEYQKADANKEYRLKYDTDNAQRLLMSTMNIIPVDTYRPAEFDKNFKLTLETQSQFMKIMCQPEHINGRNKTILENVNKVRTNALLLVGFGHLKGLIENQTPDPTIYHRVTFDTTGTLCFGLFRESLSEDLIFPYISEEIIRLKLVGNLLGYTLKRANKEIEEAINSYFSCKDTLEVFISQQKISICIRDYLYSNDVVIDAIAKEKFKAHKF